MRQNYRNIGVLFLLISVLFNSSSVVYGQEISKTPERISMKASVNKTYSRIILSTEISDFRIQKKEGRLYIIFKKPVAVDFSNSLEILKDQLDEITLSDDNKTIFFGLKNPSAKVRKFIGEGVIGLDLFADSTTSQTYKFESVKKEEAAKPISILPEQRIRAISRFAKMQEKPKITLRFKPSVAITAAAEKQEIPAAKPKATEKEDKPLEKTEISSENSEKDQKKQGSVKPREINKLDLIEEEVDVERMRDRIKLTFPWKLENVGAAVLARERRLWIVFDKFQNINMRRLKELKYIDTMRQIPHHQYTILVADINPAFQTNKLFAENNLINFRAYREGTAWALEVEEVSEIKEEIERVANNLPAYSKDSEDGPEVFISAEYPSNPIEIIDTEIGDKLAFIPLKSGETGIAIPRNFVGFNLPITTQGVVIEILSDQIKYKSQDDGIKITGKLNLSPELYSKEEVTNNTKNLTSRREKKFVPPSETVFPFEYTYKQQLIENLNISEIKQRMLTELVNSPDSEKSDRRLEMAKFYFANSLYAESIGTLGELKALDPTFKNMQEVDIIMAASDYLLERYKESVEEFRGLAEEVSEDGPGYDELRLWEWASSFQSARGDRKKNTENIPIDYVVSYDKFLSHYPEKLRYSFGLLAAEELLDKGDSESATVILEILEIISSNTIPEKYKNDTKYLWGRLAETKGDIDKAIEIWSELTNNSEDRFNRARATFDMTRLKLLHGKIGLEEAIDIFDKIGIIWRGDSFEIELLKLAGQLNIKKGQYMKGLKYWQTLVTNFPNTKEAIFIAGRMKKVFVQLFDEGDAYKLSPLDALNIYFEFRELTPVGERGDKIIQQLANHFINADLLDNAAALLAHQVNFRASGQEKEFLALKLIELELKNRKPERALDSLKFIDMSKASDDIKHQASILEARAYVNLYDFTKALDIIKEDFSLPAQNIRLDIFWHNKNWFGIIDIVESRLDDMRNTRPDLSEEQERNIVRLAVAYASQEYREKLSKLEEDFGKRLKNENGKNVFSFVTNDIPSVNYKNFEETLQLKEIESFLNEYSFWPGKDWKNVVSVLTPKTKKLKNKSDPLTLDEKKDIIRLAIAYSMLPQDKETIKALNNLQREFRNITVDKETIDVFEILDDKFIKKRKDALFEGKISITGVPEFIKLYQAAESINELNITIK